MLSQGDFTRFLKASENERSELLEKITDSIVYSEISSFVYEQTKNAGTELNKLNEKIKDVVLLDEEQRLEYQNALVENKFLESNNKKEKERNKNSEFNKNVNFCNKKINYRIQFFLINF
jgi:exonuclease SbcC